MNKRSWMLVAVAAAALCTTSFAATEYVIVNNNVYLANNSATVYSLDTTTGILKQAAVLDTDGGGSGGFLNQNFLGDIEQAILPNANCIFVMDVGNGSDIATFSKSTGYQRVGSYSNSAVSAGDFGASLALTPNGKFLYVSYGGTGNVGGWTVNPDCSLTFTAAYLPSGGPAFGALKVAPNGVDLIVPVSSHSSGGELFQIDEVTGVLSDLNYLSFSSIPTCNRSILGCTPAGVDITKDSRIAVFSSNYDNEFRSVPIALTARISPTGLVSPRIWNLQNPDNLVNNISPFLSAAAYAGSGNLYFGLQGGDGVGLGGVIVASFTESPLNVTLVSSTVVESPTQTIGGIAATGNVLVIAEWTNNIAVYSINNDGSLTLLQTTTDNNAQGLSSLSIFPDTR